MKFPVASLITLAFAAAANAQGTFTIFTPASVVQCLPALISWEGGVAPYFLSVLPGGQPSAPPIVDLGRQTGTSVTWQVNIAAGTSIGLTLRDSTGAIAQSSPFTVQAGGDSSCLNTTSTGTGPTTSGGSTPPPTSATTTGTTATQTRPTTTGTGTGTGTSTGATGGQTGNSASAKIMNAGIAGAIGAVLAVVIA